VYDLDVAADAASTEVEEYTEEHAAEDGLLWEAVDGNKVGKKSATGRLKEAKKGSLGIDVVSVMRFRVRVVRVVGEG
jgi:type I restriction enzyme M protein